MAAIGQELLNVPMGDMIRQMAFAIADAQVQLDEASMYVAEVMSGKVLRRDEEGNPVLDDDEKPQYDSTTVHFGEVDQSGNVVERELSMMELGFTPTFYQFIDTIIEVKIAIKITSERTQTTTTKSSTKKLGWSKGIKVTATNVDATYASKYGYSAEGSSLLRTKLAPVPPPSVLQDRIRQLIEARQNG